MNGPLYTEALMAAARLNGGPWLAPGQPTKPLRPADLASLPFTAVVYVALMQYVGEHRVEYIGSAVRPTNSTAWQRIVKEHQRQQKRRLRDWSRVAVIGLNADTPIAAARILEGVTAQVFGRPPGNDRLPRPPANWRSRLVDLART